MTRIQDIGELKLIERIARRTRVDKSVVKGIGDDAAVIKCCGGKYMLFASDILVEDVHFTLKNATPFQIGWKALGRNISDIAAMGGIPRYCVVSASLPPKTPVKICEGIYDGIRALAGKFGVNIVGGDTTRGGKIVIDVAIIGEAEKENVVYRSGARRGDAVFVTGSLGGWVNDKDLNFSPRVREAEFLTKNFKINSMIDISDGLALDLSRIVKASGVGAAILEPFIPVAKGAPRMKAITHGEDFELLFTMSEGEARRFFKSGLGRMKTPVTFIGEIIDKKYGLQIIDRDGKVMDIKEGGFLHF